jgi:hypothetical protein
MFLGVGELGEAGVLLGAVKVNSFRGGWGDSMAGGLSIVELGVELGVLEMLEGVGVVISGRISGGVDLAAGATIRLRSPVK